MSLFSSVLHALTPGGNADPALEAALARVVERLPVNLKQSRHWPGRYRAAIGHALAQAWRVSRGVPGPITLDREHWVKDAQVHALFASVEDMRRAQSASPALRAYFAGRDAGEAYALLSLRREEKKRFGVAAAGGVLRRDVAQHLIWFGDPQFLAPAASEAEARDALLWAMFDRFVARLLVGVERLREERERLTREKDLAQARLRGAPPDRHTALQGAFGEQLTRLGEIGQLLEPDHLHEVFATILSHPDDCLYLEEHGFHLDAMGVVHAADDGERVATLNFVDLVERYQEPRTVLLARCPYLAPIDFADRLKEARKWL